jgi:hypothetical protein
MKFELRSYQKEISAKGLEILKDHKILILNLEVRVGKSHIAHEIGRHYKSVLFITKKNAIQSIQDDYKTANHSFDIIVTNYENLHKISGKFDLVIADEFNEKISAFPKPTLNAKRVNEFVTNDLMLVSGTITPESNSQIYHPLWVSPFSPFKDYKNFYAFHRALGVPKVIYTSYGQAKDYSDVPYKNILPYINKIKISFSQAEAGFKVEIKEIIHNVKMNPKTLNLINRLKKDLVIEGKEETILGDSAVKLMSKIHQLSSGTIKFESGNSKILDTSKIDFIKEKFEGQKIAIFYKFKEELNLIKSVYDLAESIEEFDNSNKNIAFQFVSGRSGIKLDKADCIVALNIDFGATTYFQFRARTITSKTKEALIHWIFSDVGFEHQVYKSVMKKKSFTTMTFKKL